MKCFGSVILEELVLCVMDWCNEVGASITRTVCRSSSLYQLLLSRRFFSDEASNERRRERMDYVVVIVGVRICEDETDGIGRMCWIIYCYSIERYCEEEQSRSFGLHS